MEDSELIRGTLEGQEGSYDELVRRHLPLVHRYCFRMLGNEHDAEDAVQDTFVKAWRGLKRFRAGENFRSWLMRIARNASIDILRKRRDVPFAIIDDSGDSMSDSIASEEPLPDELAARIEDGRQLTELLSHLTPQEREVLSLHHEESLTFREIAEILQSGLDTVKSRYRRALLHLRALLDAPKPPRHT